MSNDQTYRKARRRVEAKLGFLIHLSVYVIVNILLVAINLMTFSKYLWFIWAARGWSMVPDQKVAESVSAPAGAAPGTIAPAGGRLCRPLRCAKVVTGQGMSTPCPQPYPGNS